MTRHSSLRRDIVNRILLDRRSAERPFNWYLIPAPEYPRFLEENGGKDVIYVKFPGDLWETGVTIMPSDR